jgi:hypothetical protein
MAIRTKKDEKKVRLYPNTYWLALRDEENRNWASLGRVQITVWKRKKTLTLSARGHEAESRKEHFGFFARLPACEAALDTSATQEPTASNETEQSHGGV